MNQELIFAILIKRLRFLGAGKKVFISDKVLTETHLPAHNIFIHYDETNLGHWVGIQNNTIVEGEVFGD